MKELTGSQEEHELMTKTAKLLKELFNGYGFALIVFDFHKPGISNYVSNAQRKEMIMALRETAERLEKRQDVQPGQEN